MNKKMLSVFFSLIIIFGLILTSYSEDLNKQSIKGVIKEISSDGTYFTINDSKINITKDKKQLKKIGHELLMNRKEEIKILAVVGEKIEKSGRTVIILKPMEIQIDYC